MPATDSEEFYRKMEHDAILKEPGSEKQDFYVSKVKVDEYTENKIISKGFDSICLLHKLRETRAFTGFSRWLPVDGKALEAKKDFIKLGASINWLPAIVVRGEGVFFKFNEKSLKMQGGVQATLSVLIVMGRGQTHAILLLVITVRYYRKPVAKNQICYLIGQC